MVGMMHECTFIAQFSIMPRARCSLILALVTINLIYGLEDTETMKEYWHWKGKKVIEKNLKTAATRETHLDNVIFMVGNGMSISTIRAAGLLKAQKDHGDNSLSFEDFPIVGFAKTYCEDYQVGDSACVATAYSGGFLGKFGQVGLLPNAKFKCGDNNGMMKSIAQWALDAGKDVGIVTNGRLTDPLITPMYGHGRDASWEADADVLDAGEDPTECSDFADQLISGSVGRRTKVILGGGRSNFLPMSVNKGRRRDGRNLISDWIEDKRESRMHHAYVDNAISLKEVVGSPHLLGLFSYDNFEFSKMNNTLEPSLKDMVEAAIKILSDNPKGYFLFVVGGNIRRAHAKNQASYALDETLKFSEAAKMANDMTDPKNTLTIVTADHGNTMSISGYSDRYNDILGLKGHSKLFNYTYPTLSYATGPGYVKDFRMEKSDGMFDGIGKDDFMYPSGVPTEQEKIGGEDVGVFIQGPHQEVFIGSYDMHLIPHMIGYAACIGPGMHSCNSSANLSSSISLILLIFVVMCLVFLKK